MKKTVVVSTVQHGWSLAALSLLTLGLFGFMVVARAGSLTPVVVGFDNITDMAAVPNGYAGLNWANFVAISQFDPAFYNDGYYNALDSTPNVVFNPYGNNASISSSNAFNLSSAYMAAAGRTTARLEVQGYNGTNLLYDQIFTLDGGSPDGTNSTPPTIPGNAGSNVTFNYNGVTLVNFIAGSQFAMDNLSISVLVPTNGSQTPIDLGQVVDSSIGHTFIDYTEAASPTNPAPAATPNPVADYLVDQSQESGGGAILPSVTADFDTNSNFELTISAPPGQQFMVEVPAGQQATMVANLEWQEPDALANDFGVGGTVSLSFGSLNGIIPGYNAQCAELSQLHSFCGVTNLEITPITNNVSFTSLTLTATVPLTDMDSGLGAVSYTPLVKYFGSYLEDNDYILFYYTTSQTNDPGRFVSLVPLDAALVTPRPALSIAAGLNGGITLTFVGTLQSASQITGPYSDVPGNPQGSYTIAKASMGMQSYFRTVTRLGN